MFGWRRNRRKDGAPAPEPFGHLLPGRRYRVARGFTDHDGVHHPVGESWTFLRSSFLPYEDGLSLFMETPDGVEQQIRLQRRREAEEAIVEHLHEHILPAPGATGAWTLLLTRDSVCLADDIDYPHAATLDVPRDADALAVARAILAHHFPAWVGSNASWSFALGADRVLLGYRYGLRFSRPFGTGPLTARAEAFEQLHLTYWAQKNPAEILKQHA